MLKRLFSIIIICCVFCSFCALKSFADDYKFKDISAFETERLILQPSTFKDLEILSGYLMDREVTKYLDPSIKKGFDTQNEALEFLNNAGQSGEKISFAVKLKDSKNLIGQVETMLFRTNYGNMAMISYWLGKDFQGKGYAREACYSLSNKVLAASDIDSIFITCDCRNFASIKLAGDILDYLEKNNKYLKLSRSQEIFDLYESIKAKMFQLKKLT